MSRFMRNGFMASMGAIIAVGIGISLWQDAGGALTSVRRELGLAASGEPVLVIFVADAKAVASVRAAVADERVVAESPNAFALSEGRIIAEGGDAASEILSLAGWVDRDLKLMRVRKRASPSPLGAGGSGQQGSASGELAELLSKDKLTYAEASQLLDHI